MGKLHADQRTAIADLVNAGMASPEIARVVTQQTGRPTTSSQVNGYRNVILGIANGARNPQAAGVPALTPAGSGGGNNGALKVQSAGSAAPGSDGFSAVGGGGQDEFTAGATSQGGFTFNVYRKDGGRPGYLGRIDSFSIREFSELVCDGLYRVDKLFNDRIVGRWDDLRVAIGKPARMLDGRLAENNGVPPMHLDPRQGMPGYGMPGYGMPPYGYAGYPGYPYGPTPVAPQDPTVQFRNLAEVAKTLVPAPDPAAGRTQETNAALGFASAVMGQQNAGGGGMTQWLQTFLATQATEAAAQRAEDRRRHEADLAAEKIRREDDRKEADIQRRADKTEAEERHTRDLARTKLDFEQAKERDKTFFTQLMAINDKKAEQVEDLKNSVNAQTQAMQEDLDAKVGVAKQHFDQMYQLQKNNLDSLRVMQDQLYQQRKESLDSQRTEGVFARTIESGLNRLGNSFDRISMLKATKDLPPGERDILLKFLANSNGAAISGGGNGNGNGHNGNGHNGNGNGHKEGDPVGDFRQEAIDKVLSSEFFKALQEEWAVYINAPAEFCDPGPFVVMFMQWVQKSPNMAVFAGYLIVRDWKTAFAVMAPKLSSANLETFKKPEAEAFYTILRKRLAANMKLVSMQAEMVLQKQAQQQSAAPV